MTNFETLDKSKRERIINAAMSEFRYGYKKASTDAIVRSAGISKGLLFHYFVSKEQLYKYCIDYAIGIFAKKHQELMDFDERDMLEGVWQICKLKSDVCRQHPNIYDFISGAYVHIADTPPGVDLHEIQSDFNAAALERLYNKSDLSLFRPDIDISKAVNIMFCAIEGLFLYHRADGEEKEKNQEPLLADIKEYLDIFRKCFYK